MPPRTRKSAETAPPAPDTTTAAAESEQRTPEPAEPEAQAEPVPAPAGSSEAEGGAAGETTPPQAAAPQSTYHWETTGGTPADPCRACPPGGPPPGVGSYGCPHGQWVRVQGTD